MKAESVTPSEAEILEALDQLGGLASVSRIDAALSNRVSRRSLQRRLKDLVLAGRIRRRGQGRTAHYQSLRVSTLSADLASSARMSASLETSVPASAQGERVRRYVGRPLATRRRVGYSREFMDSYVPNQSFYLTAEERSRLQAEGSLPGEIQPAGTYARQLLGRLLIDLSWNSSRLEGNTYSLLETQRLLELGQVAEGRNRLEAQMILNHKSAIELLVEQAEEIGFNRYTLLNLHALLSDNLLDDPQAGGRLRSLAVGISGSAFVPLEVPQLIEEYFDRLLDKAGAISDPFEQAFFVLVHVPYLQPFVDVNKRVSRLAANIPLVKKNLIPLAYVDVPESSYVEGILGVYELLDVSRLKDVFLFAYGRSCARYSAIRQSLGEPDPFRFRHAERIKVTVAHVVRNRLDTASALRFIEASAAELPQVEATRFQVIVETDLLSLHAGNIARYGLRPSEWQDWEASRSR